MACSARMHNDINQTSQCGGTCRIGEDYRLADYYYIKSYCFGATTGREQINTRLFFYYTYRWFLITFDAENIDLGRSWVWLLLTILQKWSHNSQRVMIFSNFLINAQLTGVDSLLSSLPHNSPKRLSLNLIFNPKLRFSLWKL